ncbi:MAG: fused MFS/spermidine synthase [Pseudomonadota bacterium]|nr:fused MFS/spermidine synthase [Pseudomonadota bacterium]
MRKAHLLFLIILIEGYVVLACELLAIRQLIPFVGSGTEVIAIIISGVLLPLAVGYHFGGLSFKRAYARAKAAGHKRLPIRRILLKNITAALIFLSFGMSYLFLELFFGWLHKLGLDNRLLQTAVFTVLFLVIPVFKLGQTVPLTSNYFSRRQLSEITGKMLFFSTVGSFLGSVFSTIILMTTIGVHNTVIVTLGLLGFLAIMLNGRRLRPEVFICFMMLGVVYTTNSNTIMHAVNVVSDNSYNLIRLVPVANEDSTILSINRSASSKMAADPDKRFDYVKYIEKTFLDPIQAPESPPRDILIIGAGGFTTGLNDTHNRYTFIDIDRTLKDVSEQYFLKQKLGPNKLFIPDSAREFVHSTKAKYDLIIVDTFTNVYSIPLECTTREFLLDTKARLKPNGIIIVNVISTPTFTDKFTVRYNHTFASVFPTYTRQIIGDFNPWDSGKTDVLPTDNRNLLYIYFNNRLAEDNVVYTDDKNTYSMDRE